MIAVLRPLHVLAVALWFGSVAFFTVAGLLIFQAFEQESRKEDRPIWFPVPAPFAQPSPGPGFPDPLRLEQGSRAAGKAVSKIFPVYYALQAGCGVVAFLTALILARPGEGGARGWRRTLAGLALCTVLAGWWLETEVSRLREPRDGRTDELLLSASPSAAQVEAARVARAAFGRWHGYSLIQNFATLLLTAGLTLLVPGLPGGDQRGGS